MEKQGDPYGRIVHDYGFYTKGSYSVNATHSCTRVVYNSTPQVASILDGIRWFIKADLASGYRQFGTHPVDWRFQVYCNGPDEHYIDLACPFGTTNSSLEFCPIVALFAQSTAIRYAEQYQVIPPSLGTHVDDIYGGFKGNDSYKRAVHFRQWMCETGRSLTVIFNMKVTKTPMPARKQIILGRMWNSDTRRVTTAPDKIKKYRERIASMKSETFTSCEEVESIHGCLRYVANVEPYGIPFLTPLIDLICGQRLGNRKAKRIKVTRLVKRLLSVWERMLVRNRGISMDYILQRLPRSDSSIFVDASST